MECGTIYVDLCGVHWASVDFYQVVGFSGSSVRLRQIRSYLVDRGGKDFGLVVPVRDAFIGSEFTKRQSSMRWMIPHKTGSNYFINIDNVDNLLFT